MQREPPVADCVEISQEELERQVQMERLSFISGSSANEDEGEEDGESEEDDDGEAHPGVDHDTLAGIGMLPPPPLPPKPAILLNQQLREATPMIHGTSPHHYGDVPLPPHHRTAAPPAPLWQPQHVQAEDSDGGQRNVNTVRRRAKRERNRTTGAIVVTASPKTESSSVTAGIEAAAIKARTKARSKSRSPGRSIDNSQLMHANSSANNKTVAVSSRGCAVHSVGGGKNRGQSPDDNISESSASFHENEFVPHHQPVRGHHHHHHHHQHHRQQQHHFRHVQPQPHQGSSSSSSSVVPPPNQGGGGVGSAVRLAHQNFANRDSVRDSWMSSGGSVSANLIQGAVSSGGTSDASNKSIPSSGGGAGTGSAMPAIHQHHSHHARGGASARIGKLSGPQSECNTPHMYAKSSRHHHHGGSKTSLVGPAASGVSASFSGTASHAATTFPRSSRRVQSTTAVPQIHHQQPQHHIYTKHHHHNQARPPAYQTTSRSVSRESGSSSSRTVSRSGSRTGACGLRGASGSRSGSSSALHKQQFPTPDGKQYALIDNAKV